MNFYKTSLLFALLAATGHAAADDCDSMTWPPSSFWEFVVIQGQSFQIDICTAGFKFWKAGQPCEPVSWTSNSWQCVVAGWPAISPLSLVTAGGAQVSSSNPIPGNCPLNNYYHRIVAVSPPAGVHSFSCTFSIQWLNLTTAWQSSGAISPGQTLMMDQATYNSNCSSGTLTCSVCNSPITASYANGDPQLVIAAPGFKFASQYGSYCKNFQIAYSMREDGSASNPELTWTQVTPTNGDHFQYQLKVYTTIPPVTGTHTYTITTSWPTGATISTADFWNTASNKITIVFTNCRLSMTPTSASAYVFLGVLFTKPHIQAPSITFTSSPCTVNTFQVLENGAQFAGASADSSNYSILTSVASLKNTPHTLELYVSVTEEPTAKFLVETLSVTFRSECEYKRDGSTLQTFTNNLGSPPSASFTTLSFTGQPASWTFNQASFPFFDGNCSEPVRFGTTSQLAPLQNYMNSGNVIITYLATTTLPCTVTISAPNYLSADPTYRLKTQLKLKIELVSNPSINADFWIDVTIMPGCMYSGPTVRYPYVFLGVPFIDGHLQVGMIGFQGTQPCTADPTTFVALENNSPVTWASVDDKLFHVTTTHPDANLKDTTHTIVLFVRITQDPTKIFKVQQWNLTFRSQCEYQRDGTTRQTFRSACAATFKTTAIVGPTAMWTFTASDFPFFDGTCTEPIRITPLPIANAVLASNVVVTPTTGLVPFPISLSAPNWLVPNDYIQGNLLVKVELVSNPSITETFSFPVTVAPNCQILQQPIQLPMITFYLGDPDTSWAQYPYLTFGECSQSTDYQVSVDGQPLTSLVPWLKFSQAAYTLMHTNDHSLLGKHDVFGNVINLLAPKVTWTIKLIESFRIEIRNPCWDSTIEVETLSDLKVELGTFPSFKIQAPTLRKPTSSNDYQCGMIQQRVYFIDSELNFLAYMEGDLLRVNTQLLDRLGLTEKFLLASVSKQACIVSYLKDYPDRKTTKCFQISFTQAKKNPRIKAEEQITAFFQAGDNFVFPLKDLVDRYDVYSLETEPRVRLVFSLNENASLSINWQAIQDFGLYDQYIDVVFILTEQTDPTKAIKVKVTLKLPQRPEIASLEPADQTKEKQVLVPNWAEILLAASVTKDPTINQDIAGQLTTQEATTELLRQSQLNDTDYHFFDNHKGLSESGFVAPMKARIEYVSTNGTVTAQFNQPFVFPDGFVDAANFLSNQETLKLVSSRQLEECEVECKAAQLVAPEMIEQFKQKPLLELSIFMREFDSNAIDRDELLKYTWQVSSVDQANSKFAINLDFEHPAEISTTSQPEFVQLTFNYPEFFVSTYGNKLHTRNAVKTIPQQWINSVKQKSTELLGGAAEVATMTLAVSNFIVNWFLSTSLALLWGLINVLQMILILPLIQVTYPINAKTFNGIILTIANFDIIPSSDLVQKVVPFGPQSPYNEAFNSYGFTSHAIFINMGTAFFILFGSLVILPLVTCILKRIDDDYGARNDRIRNFYRRVKACLVYNYYLRLFLEVYLDLAITAFINLYVVKQSFDNTFAGDLISSVIAIASTVAVLVMPLIVFTLITDYRDHLNDEEYVSKFGELTGNVHQTRYYYTLIFMLRRLATAAIVVFIRNNVVLQITAMGYMQMAYIIKIGLTKPLAESSDNFNELLGEVFVMICIYHLFYFTDWVATSSTDTYLKAGFTQCFVVGIFIAINLYQLAKQTVLNVIQKIKERKMEKMQKLLQQRVDKAPKPEDKDEAVSEDQAEQVKEAPPENELVKKEAEAIEGLLVPVSSQVPSTKAKIYPMTNDISMISEDPFAVQQFSQDKTGLAATALQSVKQSVKDLKEAIEEEDNPVIVVHENYKKDIKVSYAIHRGPAAIPSVVPQPTNRLQHEILFPDDPMPRFKARVQSVVDMVKEAHKKMTADQLVSVESHKT